MASHQRSQGKSTDTGFPSLPSAPRVEANEHMHVIVQDSEHRAPDREVSHQLLETIIDPLLAMFVLRTAQKSATDASGDAMIPRRNRFINDG
jgi:hypothetical protein